MSDTLQSDRIGVAIRKLIALNDINDHIAMRAILGKLVREERARAMRAILGKLVREERARCAAELRGERARCATALRGLLTMKALFPPKWASTEMLEATLKAIERGEG